MPKAVRGKLVIVGGAVSNIGDAAVGKSSLAQAFHSDFQTIPKNYTMTTGVELLTKTVHIPDSNNSTLEYYIYDCAGMDTFGDTVAAHVVSPDMVMLVYDVTNDSSFNSCTRWMERVGLQRADKDTPVVLVANKIDLGARRRITSKMGEQLANTYGMAYVECSAKENANVEEPFMILGKEFVNVFMRSLREFHDLS